MMQIEIDRLKGQILSKIKMGDYLTLGKMLGKSREAARTRFRRNKEDAVLAMQRIVDNRDKLIASYRKIAKNKAEKPF